MANIIHVDHSESPVTVHTKYYNVEDFSEFLDKHKTKLTILSLNIDSLNSKFDDLSILVNTLAKSNTLINIICIQEARIRQGTDIEHFKLDGYSMITQPYTEKCSKKGGLVTYADCTYVSNNINIVNYNTFNTFTTWEGLSLDIIDNSGKQITICNVYRPPKYNNNYAAIESFIKDFSPIIRNINSSSKNVILTGDFNIDLLKLNSYQSFQEFYDTLAELYLLPIITLPTRVSLRNATLIDHMYCKSPNPLTISDSGILVSKISDHMVIFAALNFNINTRYKQVEKINTRMFTDNNRQGFVEELEDIDWHQVFDHDTTADPIITYDHHFSNILDEIVNKHFPSKCVKFNKYKHKKSKWKTHDLLMKIKERDKLYVEFNKTQPDTNSYIMKKAELKIKCKDVRKMTRDAKLLYYNLEFTRYKEDIKKTWETTNDVMNKSKMQSKFPSYFNINGTKLTDKKDIATEFNKFFINIGPKLASEIGNEMEHDFSSYMNKTKIDTTFHVVPIDEEQTLTIISQLKPKTSMGYDNISQIVLQKSAKPLTCIINKSLITGMFPNKLKIAKIIPI